MKRTLILLLTTLLTLTLCGCGQEAPVETNIPIETALPVETSEAAEEWALFESVFLPIAEGKVGHSPEAVTALIGEAGYTCSTAEGMLSVLDPDHSGSFLSGLMSNDFGIARLSYHYIIEEGEIITDRVQRAVMVDFTEGAPRYFAALDWMGEGTEVDSPEDLARYLATGIEP